MAQLILTDEEMALDTFSDLDIETLAKFVKYFLLSLKTNDEQLERIGGISAGYLLVSIANKVNATKYTQTLEDVTCDDKQIGNWKITIERVNA